MGDDDSAPKPQRATVNVYNIPRSATADELVAFFSSAIGPVFACKISSVHTNWKSLGFGRVQFDSISSAQKALTFSTANPLLFQRSPLSIAESHADIVPRGTGDRRLDDVVIRFGNVRDERSMEVLGEWRGVRVDVVDFRGGMMMAICLEEGGEVYKLEVPFGDVVNSFACRIGDGMEHNAVLLQLQYAPKIYHRISGPSLNTKFNSARYHFCKEDVKFLWVRAPDFSAASVIGRSYYLCLELANGLSSSKILKSLPFFGELGDLILMPGEVFCSSSKLVPILSCPGDCTVSYEVLFQLNSLVHLQKISSAHVNLNLFRVLSQLSSDTAIKILMMMHKLNSTCHKPIYFIQNHISRFGKQQSLSSNGNNQEKLMSCRRVLITPSKVYFLGPELETSNYVVKHFSAYASDFLRVTFVDEDRCKLPSQAISTRIGKDIFSKPYRTGIYNRILSVLRDGISIGSKKFDFLAFSASQLRDSSIWMFASNDFVTASSIREWMGQFNEIYSVSKCAARMGQLFSSSTPTFNVPSREVKVIPDIETISDGVKYCFSDGIGKISVSFAKQVAKKLGLINTPSAFQIRYGGYKGVITVDRTSFCKLSLRPSMLKFKSNNTMLNVTKCSESQPCYLNREIVILLSTLGVDDEIFELLQHDQMRLLDNMLTSKEAALRVLGRMKGSAIKTALKMLMHGYAPDSEPYLLALLKAYREYQLSDIRSRCRIFVPRARVLIGSLDELGTLEYGQVFLKVSMTDEELQNPDQAFFTKVDKSTAVVVGKVVITKNPCLHPGDIRVVEAVYDPKLDNMGWVDCLVFPQKGQRPHPNECSGGDLDGDLFSISWDERLIPTMTVAPMDYISRRPRLMDHKVSLEEVHKFFIDYMLNDNLGAISTAHLVHADSEPDKALSTKCLKLATLHSMAVDYAKTGAPAEMPSGLRPKKFPDFMERAEKPSYKSSGVLGKLYRAAINPHNISQNIICEEIPYDYDLEVDGFEEFLTAAEEFYSRYAERLSALMKYYDIKYEDEILTGYVRSRQAYLNDKRKYEDMKDRILIAVNGLHKEVEEWFRSSCNENEFKRMAAAWYHVTYHPKYSGSGTKFLSFPWAVCDVLLSIKASKAGTSQEVNDGGGLMM